MPAAPGSEVLVIQSRHPHPAAEHSPSHFSILTPSDALAHLELLFCSSLPFQRVPRAQPALITAGEAGMGARSGRLDLGVRECSLPRLHMCFCTHSLFGCAGFSQGVEQMDGSTPWMCPRSHGALKFHSGWELLGKAEAGGFCSTSKEWGGNWDAEQPRLVVSA